MNFCQHTQHKCRINHGKIQHDDDDVIFFYQKRFKSLILDELLCISVTNINNNDGAIINGMVLLNFLIFQDY